MKGFCFLPPLSFLFSSFVSSTFFLFVCDPQHTVQEAAEKVNAKPEGTLETSLKLREGLFEVVPQNYFRRLLW